MWKIVLTWFENCQFVVWVAGWAPNILTFDNLTHTWKLFYFRKKKQKEYLLILQSHHPFLHQYFTIFWSIFYIWVYCAWYEIEWVLCWRPMNCYGLTKVLVCYSMSCAATWTLPRHWEPQRLETALGQWTLLWSK